MQKGWFPVTLFAFLCLLPLFADRSDFQKYRYLADDPYWQTLLHIKNGKSDIDDPAFFLTTEERFSAESELDATLKALRDANQTLYCRYPARIAWLKERVPELFEGRNDTACQKLEETLQKEDIHFVTLVFPTAYINSPASMFGHTFLRLDRTLSTPLIGEAVNYAAQTDETNGLIYTWKGLTGGYRGYYSVLPYYRKIKEYSAMEQRDMWEYTLDLDDAAIRRMLYHLYELQGIYGDYYFFTKNCSYNLLWLVQSSGVTPPITETFRYKAIPIDTIRVLKKEGLIRSVHFRPSKRREMATIVEKIADKSLAKAFVHDYDTTRIAEQNVTQQAYLCDLALMQLKHNRSQKKLTKRAYIKKLMALSRYRSRLPKRSESVTAKPENPLRAHKSAKLTLGIGTGGNYLLGFKPAMHDIYDIERGFSEGAYIDFLSLQMTKKGLERFDFVSVTSLVPVDTFFTPWSWRVHIGVQRLREKSDRFRVGGGVGKSAKLAGALGYILFTPQIYMGRSMEVSAGFDTGILWNSGKRKIGLSFRRDYFDRGWQRAHLEAFVTWQFAKETALNLKLYEDKIAKKEERTALLSLFYYF